MSSGCCIEREDIWLTWEDQDGEEFAMLNFSKEILDTLGWQEGDDLIFLDQEDGSVLIKKADENQ